MKRHQHGTTAEEGIYLNVPSIRFAYLEEAGPLPRVERGDWVRMPDLLLLLGAPLIGLAYVIFLPVIGFVMLAGVTLGALAKTIVPVLAPATRVLRPVWQPALAYFGRGRRKAGNTEEEVGHEEEPEHDEWVEQVEEELRDSE